MITDIHFEEAHGQFEPTHHEDIRARFAFIDATYGDGATIVGVFLHRGGRKLTLSREIDGKTLKAYRQSPRAFERLRRREVRNLIDAAAGHFKWEWLRQL